VRFFNGTSAHPGGRHSTGPTRRPTSRASGPSRRSVTFSRTAPPSDLTLQTSIITEVGIVPATAAGIEGAFARVGRAGA